MEEISSIEDLINSEAKQEEEIEIRSKRLKTDAVKIEEQPLLR